jgi:hypothetical protein
MLEEILLLVRAMPKPEFAVGRYDPDSDFIGEEAMAGQRASRLMTNIRTIMTAVAGPERIHDIAIEYNPPRTVHLIGTHQYMTGDLLNAFWAMAAAERLKIAIETRR